MAGLRKISVAELSPTPGGNVYLWMPLPVGGHLKFAAAQDGTTGSLRALIFLCHSSLIDKSSPVIRGIPPSDFLPLVDDAVQGGISDWVRYKGQDGGMDISQDFNTLVAFFSNTITGDILRLVAAYE